MPPEPPVLSGRFTHGHPLTQGPVGAPWRARVPATGVEVVVKPRRSGDLARLATQQRMRSLSALDTPPVQRLPDLSQEGREPAVVSEHVPGPSLRDCLSGEPVNTWQMLNVAADLLSGRVRLHDASPVLRDIGPDNIILSPGRGAVLIDCDALGELTVASTQGRTTVIGQIIGKPPDIAQEQPAGAPQIAAVEFRDPGAVLFEAVTARPLRRATTLPDLPAEALSPEPAPMVGVPEALRPLLSRLLAGDPAARPDAAQAAELPARHPEPQPGGIEGRRPRLPVPGPPDPVSATPGASGDRSRPIPLGPIPLGPIPLGPIPLGPVGRGIRMDRAPTR